MTRKAKLGLRTCDGYTELLRYLRSDIQEVASRLQKGGLGYLDDNVDIEEQVIISLHTILDVTFSSNSRLFLYIWVWRIVHKHLEYSSVVGIKKT